MERRKFFAKALAIVGIAGAFCMRAVEAADSFFRWPSYPSTEALRRHIATSSKHPEYNWGSVQGKSRSQLISMHDNSHFRRNDKAPMSKSGSSSKKSSPKKSSSKKSKSKSTKPKMTNARKRKR